MKSVVVREEMAGQPVYRKQYLAGDWDCAEEAVKSRAEREADLISRVSELPDWPNDLGRMQLLARDRESARVVTAEVPGSPVERVLLDDKFTGDERLRAIHAAGDWVRRFQQLEIRDGDDVQFSDRDPWDIAEYCDIRLQKIQSLGYSWLTDDRRKRILRGAEQLTAAGREESERRAWSHNDLTPGNMMWDSERLTVIDFGMSAVSQRLLDVATLIHRMQLLPYVRPWKKYPVDAWTDALLMGYRDEAAVDAPYFQAISLRLWVCRLQTLVRQPPETRVQAVHNVWMRRCVRRELMQRSAV